MPPEQAEADTAEVPKDITDASGDMYFPLVNTQDLYLDGASVEDFPLVMEAEIPITEEDINRLTEPDC